MLALWNRPILEVGRVDVFPLDNPALRVAAEEGVASDFQRAVGRAGVGHDDFVCYRLDRFNARTDVAPFVLAGNQDRKLGGHWASCSSVRIRKAGRRLDQYRQAAAMELAVIPVTARFFAGAGVAT